MTSGRTDKTIGFGNIVVIGHKLSDGKIIASVYGHMKDISPCSVGSMVNKGDIIGLIGDTGLPGTTNHHLHFEIIKFMKDIEKASSKVWNYDAPIIDKSSKQIYIRCSDQKDKVSGNKTGEKGWYWPKTETKIIENYEDPSDFIKTRPSTNNDTTAPSVPTELSATAASSSQIDLSWAASTDNVGVSGYKIYRNNSYLKSVTSTSTSDTGLSASTQYCYTVSAYDAAGNESAQSSQVCGTTSSTVIVQAYSQHWSNGYYAQFYVDDSSQQYSSVTVTGPYISGSLSLTNSGGKWERSSGGISLGSTSPATPLSYNFTLVSNTGTTDLTDDIEAFVEQFATNLSPSGTGVSSNPTFSWTGVGSGYTYMVQVYDSSNYNTVWNSAYNLTATSIVYTGPTLTSGATYYYDVMVRDTSGNFSAVRESFVVQ